MRGKEREGWREAERERERERERELEVSILKLSLESLFGSSIFELISLYRGSLSQRMISHKINTNCQNKYPREIRLNQSACRGVWTRTAELNQPARTLKELETLSLFSTKTEVAITFML